MNDFILHYEPAFYSLDLVSNQHRITKRKKREVEVKNKEPDVVFNFTAHNR